MHARRHTGQRLGADECGTGSGPVASVNVAGGVANHPRCGEVEIEVVGGLVEHAGGGLPA